MDIQDLQELTENKPGLIGLIVAVVGLLLVFVSPYLGVVGLAGLIVASRGMKEEPKALAIGGMSVGGLCVVLMLVFNFMGPSGPSQPRSKLNSEDLSAVAMVTATLEGLKVSIGEYAATNGGLPEMLIDLGAPPQMYMDPWGNPFIVKRTSSNTFQVSSFGPDGQAETTDDIFVEGGF